MDATLARALGRGRLAEITTTGYRTGRPRRIEIWFHVLDGRVYLTGLPGRRGWYANLRADPRLTFHLKGAVRADLPARARPITDEAERRAFFARIGAWGGASRNPEAWLARSPLVEVVFGETTA